VHIVDGNVLLNASNERSPDHSAAVAWLDGALDGTTTVGFAWMVVLTFLRVSTSPAAFARSLSVEAACAVIEHWLAQPAAVEIEPGADHLDRVRRLLAAVGTAGNLVNDAHLAALALEYDAEVVSFDRDFARFEGVRWRVPG